MPPQDRNLSMVFQSYALYPHLTVRENLTYPLRKMSLDSDERTEKVDSVASVLGISEHLDKQPDQLSGGNNSVSRSVGRSSANRESSSWTSRCRIWMRSSA